MAKKNSINNDFLKSVRNDLSPKVYDLVLKLVNENREDMAKIVLKIDYLLEYTSNCIKARDYDEARETLDGARKRIEMLKNEGEDVSYLEYLYEGINKKCK